MSELNAKPFHGSPWRIRFTAGTVLVIAAVAAAVAVHAQGMPGPGGHGGPGPDMMMFGGPPEHMARGIDRMLDGLGVSDAQRAQIKQIAMAAGADLRAQHEAARGFRQKGVQIFTAPTVDAGAAESLRQQMAAQHDQASKRVLQAMLEVSRVLTPEQRAKIGERIAQREAVQHDRMERMHRERGEHGPGDRPGR